MVERSQVLGPIQMPPRLRELPEPPDEVWLVGRPPYEPAVAIVGSRNPTVEAHRYAQELAGQLTRAGVAVLSGGAKGIDTAVHEGALQAGSTWVVAPSGWHRPYPQENASLYRRIVETGGGYLSLASDETIATRARFFGRNGALVALARLVIVVEAGYRSGVMNAAKWARQLGRPVFWVPSPPWNTRGRGFAAAIERGWAEPCLGPRQILERLDELGAHRLRVASSLEENEPPEVSPDGRAGVQKPSPSSGRVTSGRPPRGLSPDQVRILATLDRPSMVETVSQRTGLSPQVVGHELLQLLLMGHVETGVAGLYERTRAG